MAFGFFPHSYLLTQSAVVNDLLTGEYNVQINDSATGGGAVTLANEQNDFSGGIHVASGSLVLPATTATYGQKSVLGRAGGRPLVLGPATLKFTGAATLDRDIVLLPSGERPVAAGVLNTAEGVAARLNGTLSVPEDKSYALVKTGPGTVRLATTRPGAVNRLGTKGAAPAWVGANDTLTGGSADGDGPNHGYESFNVADGRFEIATGETVTNHFHQVWVGLPSTTKSGAETEGHLDVYGGVNIIGSEMTIGRYNGTKTTAPQGCRSTLNLFGGFVTCKGLSLAYGDDTKFTMRPAVAVHGGRLETTYLRLYHEVSKGSVTVDGGSLTATSVAFPYYDGKADDATSTDFSLDVSGEGSFVCTGDFRAGHSNVTSPSVFTAEISDGGLCQIASFNSPGKKSQNTITVKDGGVLAMKNFVGSGTDKTTIHVDGGVIRAEREAWESHFKDGKVLVGPKGLTIDVHQTYAWGQTWKLPIAPAPGGQDGGVTITGLPNVNPRPLRLTTQDVTVTGGIRLERAQLMLVGTDQYASNNIAYPQTFTLSDNSILRAVAQTTTVERLVFENTMNGRIEIATLGESAHDKPDRMAHLDLRNFTPPEDMLTLTIIHTQATSVYRPKVGNYDILTFPASVDFDLSRIKFSTLHSGVLEYSLSERVEGAWRIITLTVSPAGTFFAVPANASDAWKTGDVLWGIGPWLYVHAGTLRTISPLLLTPGKTQHAGLSVAEGETLTLAGGLTATLGGFTKLGAGTLALTGDKGYLFSAGNVSAQATLYTGFDLQKSAIFDGATNGAPCISSHDSEVTVGRGNLTIGTGTDNPFVRMGSLAIGSLTTQSAKGEGDAALTMNSGSLYLNSTFYLGFVHGMPATADKDRLVSTYIQNGGTVDVSTLEIAYDKYCKTASMDARFVLNDGHFISRYGVNFGNQDTGSPYPLKASFEQNGGLFEVSTVGQVRLIGAASVAAGAEMSYTMNDGEAVFHRGYSFYNGGTKTVNLNGGRIRCGAQFNGGEKTTLNWNGTVLEPFDHPDGKDLRGPYFRYFAKVNILSGNAIVDMSGCTQFDIDQYMTGAGHLVVRGSTTNAAVRLHATPAANTYAGVVVEKGGLVLPRHTGSLAVPFVVKDGGAVVDYYGNSLDSLTFGEKETDRTVFCNYYMENNTYSLTVAKSLQVNGKVYYAVRAGSWPYQLFVPASAGGRTVLRAPKGSIDPAKFEIHPVCVAQGAAGTFSVVSVSDTQDALVLTTTSASSDHVWTADASGAWSDPSNWLLAPNRTLKDTVTFPASLSQDITVVTDPAAQAFSLNHQSDKRVKIDGPFLFTGFSSSDPSFLDVSHTSGVLELAGSVSSYSLNAALQMTRDANGGALEVSGKLEGGLNLVKKSGYTIGRPEAFGTGLLTLENSILKLTDSGVLSASVKNTAKGLGIDVPAGKTVRATGSFSVGGSLTLIGAGCLEVLNPGANLGGSQNSQDTRPYRDPAKGDAPFGSGLTIYAGTLVVDGGPDSTVKLSNGAVRIGATPIPDGTGGAHEARLVIRSGNVTISSDVAIPYGRDRAYDGVEALGLTRRPVVALDVYGGTLTTGAICMNYTTSSNSSTWNYFSSARASINIYGGEMIVKGSCGLPYHDSCQATEEGSSDSQLNVYGGIFRTTAKDITVGVYSKNVNAYPARGTITLYGGMVATPAANSVCLNQSANSIGTLRLKGGVLETGKIYPNLAKARSQAHLLFDGGTFRPLQTGQTLQGFTTFTVGEGGAQFDLSSVAALTIGQTLKPATDLPAGKTDGGVTLSASSADSVLTLGVANEVAGLLTVNGGTMKPAVASAAASAGGVSVNGAGVFDANGFDYAFGLLTGDGGLYRNGTVKVTELVSPRGSTFSVESLVFGAGATLRCPVAETEEGGVTRYSAPFVTILAQASKEGTAYLDFARSDEAPLPKGASVKVAELAKGVTSFPVLQGVNAGLPGTVLSFSRKQKDGGVTEVWATVMPAATLLYVR